VSGEDDEARQDAAIDTKLEGLTSTEPSAPPPAGDLEELALRTAAAVGAVVVVAATAAAAACWV